MVLLAVGVQQTLAQSPYLAPTPLECIDLTDPLNVVPGHEYTYTIDVPAPVGNKTYHWFVTQEINFIAAGVLNNAAAEPIGGDILASGSVWYNDPTDPGSGPTINLTWESFTLDLDEFVFVVIYVVNDDGAGCINDNLKVYRIQPLHSFTLDIANVDVNDPVNLPGDDFELCASSVQSATYDANLGGVVYDFGQNALYFVVAAANFTGSYEMSVRFEPNQNPLQGPTPNGTIGQIATLYHDTTWADLVTATTGGIALTNNGTVNFVVNNVDAVGIDGLMHYFKIVIDHNHFEAAAAAQYPYTVQIDGILVDDVGSPLGDPDDYGDMVDLGVPPGCSFGYVAFAKESTQIITRRPQVNSVPPTVVFEPIVGP